VIYLGYPCDKQYDEGHGGAVEAKSAPASRIMPFDTIVTFVVARVGCIPKCQFTEITFSCRSQVTKKGDSRNDLNAYFYTVKAALPSFLQQKSGKIINISSVIGQMGN